MAIMQSCCCFSTVRSGSQACGVYSLITSIIILALWSYNLAQSVAVYSDPNVAGYIDPATVNGIYASYSIAIIVAVLLFFASIVLLVGISNDNKAMLIPYMVAITALMALQAISWIIIFVLIGLASAYLIGVFVGWLLFTALNITCLLCVISQYQELQAGRGKANVV